jgi:hypothetical protein
VQGYCTGGKVCTIAGSDGSVDDSREGPGEVGEERPDADAMPSDAADAADAFDASDDGDAADAADGPDDGPVSDAVDGGGGQPPFSPSGVPGLILWLDPARDMTVAPTFRWADQSGAGNDATATAAMIPTVRQAAAGLPPMLDFSGDNQYLSLPAGMRDFTGGVSFFIVAAPSAPVVTTDVNAMRFLDFSTSYGVEYEAILFARFGIDGSQLLYQVYTLQYAPPAYTAPDVVGEYSRQLFEVVEQGGTPATMVSFRYFKNGTDVGGGMTNVPAVVDRASALIGRSNLHDLYGDPDYRGLMGEMLLYDRALTDDERQAVESWLLDRWQIR